MASSSYEITTDSCAIEIITVILKSAWREIAIHLQQVPIRCLGNHSLSNTQDKLNPDNAGKADVS